MLLNACWQTEPDLSSVVSQEEPQKMLFVRFTMMLGWQSSLTDLLQDRDPLHTFVLHCVFPASHRCPSRQQSPRAVRGCTVLTHKTSFPALLICSVIAHSEYSSVLGIEGLDFDRRGIVGSAPLAAIAHSSPGS